MPGYPIPKHNPPENATQVAESDVQLRNAIGMRVFENDDINEGNSTYGASSTTRGNYTVSEGYIALNDWVQLEDDNGHVWIVRACADDEISLIDTSLVAGVAVADYRAILASGLRGFRFENTRVTEYNIVTDADLHGITGSLIPVSGSDDTTIASKDASQDSSISNLQTTTTDHESRIASLELGDFDDGTAGVGGISGGNGYLDDATKSWTTNQWVGFWLIDSASAAYEILSNTETRLVLRLPDTAPASGAYRIRRQTYLLPGTVTQDKLAAGAIDLTSTKIASSCRLSGIQPAILKAITDTRGAAVASYDMRMIDDMVSIEGEIETARGGYGSLGRRLDRISSPTGGIVEHLHGLEQLGSDGGGIPHFVSVYVPAQTWTAGATYLLQEFTVPANITGLRIASISVNYMAAATRTDNKFGIRSKSDTTNKVEIALSSSAIGAYVQIFSSSWVAKYDLDEFQIYITVAAGSNETAIKANVTIGYYYSNYAFPAQT